MKWDYPGWIITGDSSERWQLPLISASETLLEYVTPIAMSIAVTMALIMVFKGAASAATGGGVSPIAQAICSSMLMCTLIFAYPYLLEATSSLFSDITKGAHKVLSNQGLSSKNKDILSVIVEIYNKVLVAKASEVGFQPTHLTPQSALGTWAGIGERLQNFAIGITNGISWVIGVLAMPILMIIPILSIGGMYIVNVVTLFVLKIVGPLILAFSVNSGNRNLLINWITSLFKALAFYPIMLLVLAIAGAIAPQIGGGGISYEPDGITAGITVTVMSVMLRILSVIAAAAFIAALTSKASSIVESLVASPLGALVSQIAVEAGSNLTHVSSHYVLAAVSNPRGSSHGDNFSRDRTKAEMLSHEDGKLTSGQKRSNWAGYFNGTIFSTGRNALNTSRGLSRVFYRPAKAAWDVRKTNSVAKKALKEMSSNNKSKANRFFDLSKNAPKSTAEEFDKSWSLLDDKEREQLAQHGSSSVVNLIAERSPGSVELVLAMTKNPNLSTDWQKRILESGDQRLASNIAQNTADSTIHRQLLNSPKSQIAHAASLNKHFQPKQGA